MSNVRLRLQPRLIESARAAQYANRQRNETKEADVKLEAKAKLRAAQEKRERLSGRLRRTVGGGLEHKKAKYGKMWTRKRRQPEDSGFLLVPRPMASDPPESPIYRITSQQWILKWSSAEIQALIDKGNAEIQSMQNQGEEQAAIAEKATEINNEINKQRNLQVLRTVVANDPTGDLIRLTSVEENYNSCEYAVLGDTRAPSDDGQQPGIWGGGNKPYNALEKRAPGFVFDATREMMFNEATYRSDRVLLTWLDSQESDWSKWPRYVGDFIGTRNFGFFHHLATKSQPSAKPDQEIYSTYNALVPMRFKRDGTKQDDTSTPGVDESIEPFEDAVYSSCTFEVIVSLGSAPLPVADSSIKEIDGQDRPMNNPSFPGQANPSNRIISAEFVQVGGSVTISDYFGDYTQTLDPIYNKTVYGTVKTAEWSEFSRGHLVVVIGDITFSIESMTRPEAFTGVQPQEQWTIYYWSSDKKIDDFVVVGPSSEYHIAVEYEDQAILVTDSDGHILDQRDIQLCEIYIGGVMVDSVERDKDEKVAASKLMATAIAGLSERWINRLVTDVSTDETSEYTTLSAFPEEGEEGRLYTALDTSKNYIWSDAEGYKQKVQYNLLNTKVVREILKFPNIEAAIAAFPDTEDAKYDVRYSVGNQSGVIVYVDTYTSELVETYTPSALFIEPTDECRVGFHSFRFTPQVLYKENFTPPEKITDLDDAVDCGCSALSP